MLNRNHHWNEVRAYLHRHIAPGPWTFILPGGSGHETYVVQDAGRVYFVKLGVDADRYVALAADKLTPEVLATGYLEDGVSIMVQPFVVGRHPSRWDYRQYLDQAADMVRKVHMHPTLLQLLPPTSDAGYQQVAQQALFRLRARWDRHKPQVPTEAPLVEEGLDRIAQAIGQVEGSGLAASHNDICNANWLLTPEGLFYLLDFEAMALDDPAYDVGALLWWYYPPELRARFLAIAGYAGDQQFQLRMWVRMAMHCLLIMLPRDNSFDTFEPASFSASLHDFKAILAGEENPQGYS